MPKAQLTLVLPRLPNFIRVEEADKYVDVADLSIEDLQAFGREWTAALMKHSVDRRKNREKPCRPASPT